LTIDFIVDYLNNLLSIDPIAISSLVLERKSKCNAQMAEHPTVQVLSYRPNEYWLGMLGVINGMFKDELIIIELDEERKLVKKFIKTTLNNL